MHDLEDTSKFRQTLAAKSLSEQFILLKQVQIQREVQFQYLLSQSILPVCESLKMKSRILNQGSMNYSKPWSIESTLRGKTESSQFNIIMESKNKKRNKENLADRFIPSKISSDAYNMFATQKPRRVEEIDPIKKTHNQATYEALLSEQILGESSKNNTKTKKIMHFNQENYGLAQNSFFKEQVTVKQTKARKIQKHAYKILEAPSLQDDFYLNLLDWSLHNNIVAGLQSSVYLWSGCSTKVVQLYQTPDISDYICSVAFSAHNPNHISFGNTIGQIKLFDITKKKEVQTLCGHTGRVGSLNWNSNGAVLASGARDGTVLIWDCRKANLVENYKAHGQEICGLKWSDDGSYIASGGNDNKLVVYSTKGSKELAKFHQHKAAVKAIGWCPGNSGTLASGGGTADRHIRFFSTQTLTQTHCFDTGSQVCNLVFSKVSNEMVSTHGYSLNQINVWSTKSNWEDNYVENIATLTGHTYRVLYLAGSPDGCSVLTGAGDQTLRFWNVFDRGDLAKQQVLDFKNDLR